MKSILPSLPRRQFLQGLATGGVLLGLSPWLKPAWAREPAATTTGSAKVLSGTEFDLTIAESAVNFTGTPRMATTVNGSIPAPTLRWREGDTVTLRVHNRLSEDTSIHWHGILLPFQMDGVPGISFKGIPPGETFTYRFKVVQTGTYWYHSHSGMQEQRGGRPGLKQRGGHGLPVATGHSRHRLVQRPAPGHQCAAQLALPPGTPGRPHAGGATLGPG